MCRRTAMPGDTKLREFRTLILDHTLSNYPEGRSSYKLKVTGSFYAISLKEENFSDFLFAFRNIKLHLEWDLKGKN